ncbi:MAG: rod shape-determining protein MreC [Zetaproteobacteria bacterium]|nr:MAG: rod shape-determining protein MreC [Zetaproteobacteria bacterium]
MRRLHPLLPAGILLTLLLLYHLLPQGALLLRIAPLVDALQQPIRLVERLHLWWQRQERLIVLLQRSREAQRQRAALMGELHHLRQENRALRRLLALPPLDGYRWITAHALAYSPDASHRRLLIDARGVAVDDTVVTSDGLVGLVSEAHAGFAVVRTILDGSLAVPVTDRSGRLHALLRGDRDALHVELADRTQQPAVGELLYTSGAGDLLPSGIPAARITSVRPIPGSMFIDIRARPTGRWPSHRWLAVAHRIAPPPRSTGRTPPP